MSDNAAVVDTDDTDGTRADRTGTDGTDDSDHTGTDATGTGIGTDDTGTDETGSDGGDVARDETSEGADASSLLAASLIAVPGLCVIPVSVLTRAYDGGTWEDATTALAAAVLPVLVVTAAAVTRAGRGLLLVASALVVAHVAGLLVLAESTSVVPLSNGPFGSPLAQLGCAAVALAVAWWDRGRSEPRSWPALLLVALGPVVGMVLAAPPWSEPWGPVPAATVAGGRAWIVAAVLAAGLVCYPRHRVRLVGVLFVVLVGLHVAYLLTLDPGTDVVEVAMLPESLTARTVLFAAVVSAAVWGLAAAVPPRLPTVDGTTQDDAPQDDPDAKKHSATEEDVVQDEDDEPEKHPAADEDAGREEVGRER